MAVQKRPAQRMGVRKAKPDESWVACYDADGTLIGIVAPDKITPVANASAGKPKAAAPKAAAAPAAAPAPAAALPEEMAKQQRIAELRKGLNAPRTAAENDRHAAQMGAAAAQVLAAILARGPSGGAPTGRPPRRGAA